MKDTWKEIVSDLSCFLTNNSKESEYQREIESCLKQLGWKKSNNTMIPQYNLHFGSVNSLRIDIVLCKNEIPILPIEIKRPNVGCKTKDKQITSYMRQLKSNIGLYIGENIQIYYDVSNNYNENAISVFKVEFSEEDKNGLVFCDLLKYEYFNKERLEQFCKECYEKRIATKNLEQRLTDFFSPVNQQENIKTLIKNKFIEEGFKEEDIENELKDIEINISLKEESKQTEQPSKNRSKSRDKHLFKGKYYFMCRFALEVIRDIVRKNPKITFSELEKFIPEELQNRTNGVVERLEDVKARKFGSKDTGKRYFMEDDEIIHLFDGTQVVVYTQWVSYGNFKTFKNAIERYYSIDEKD
ncbi:MAG: hypothetical protein IKV46_04655 [Bacteroidales bacterium]|nr:hypothetical protein [Bacteroidales bacterium]